MSNSENKNSATNQIVKETLQKLKERNLLNEKAVKKYLKEAKVDFETYHQTYSGAISAALEYLEKRGYTYNNEEVSNDLMFKNQRPKNGAHTKIPVTIFKDGKEQRKKFHIVITALENNYELVCYIN